MSSLDSDSLERPKASFATTHWSLVLAAAEGQSMEGEPALSTLCEEYWYPLYAFVRRRGFSAEDARDLVQGFFARLLEKDYLTDADQTRGRFRSFLLTAIKRYISNERERATAQKRGGGVQHLSFDYEAGESKYSHEPADQATPDRIFERRWAVTVLNRSLAQLREQFETESKRDRFDVLKVFLTGESQPKHAQIATDLGMTEGAVKVAIHRLRQEYRRLIRAAIAETVADPSEIDDELRALQAALRQNNSPSV